MIRHTKIYMIKAKYKQVLNFFNEFKLPITEIIFLLVFLTGILYYLKAHNAINKQYITNLNIKHKKDIVNKEIIIKKLSEDIKRQSLIQVTEIDLANDINTHYKNISTRVKKIIIKTIMEESTKYKINPLILYSVLHSESSFRAQILHSKRLISIYSKTKKKTIKQYIQAIGMGGIVYELHGEKLKKAGILEVKSDLFDPAINIRATAFILNEEYKKPLLKDTLYKDKSAMLRYFGGNHKWYVQRIENKIFTIISSKIFRKD